MSFAKDGSKTLEQARMEVLEEKELEIISAQ